MKTPDISHWKEHLITALESAVLPVLFVHDGNIEYTNPAFINRFHNQCGKPLRSLFQAEYAEQWHWLTNASEASHESDKILAKLTVGDINKEYMIQYWPINKNFLMLSVEENYSLERLADLDHLTHLPNRRKATMLLDIERKRAHRYSGFCITMADIDHFKKINDTYGHDVGDSVLRYVSRSIERELRKGDWVARWGGEEFLIFTAQGDILSGIQPIERILERLNSNPFPEIEDLFVTMSFGLVAYHEGNEETNTLIKKADTLLYEAKNTGRNRIVWEKENSRGLWLQKDIARAIEKKIIVPHYRVIRDKERQMIAVEIVHGLKNKTANQINQMLTAAMRLRKSGDVDYALFQSTLEIINNDYSYPILFPISPSLMAKHCDIIIDTFKQFPMLVAAISCKNLLPKNTLHQLQQNLIPIALLDFSFEAAPLDILISPAVKYLICTQEDKGKMKSMRPLIPQHINFYIIDESEEKDSLELDITANGVLENKIYTSLPPTTTDSLI